LALTVAFEQLWVPLAVLFLVVGMFVPPLLLAVAHHLEILQVCRQLLPVIIAAAPTLALRPTAHTLLRAINRGQKRTLTIGATAGLAQADSSEDHWDESLRRIETTSGSQACAEKLI
jgi:hypothetical protein